MYTRSKVDDQNFENGIFFSPRGMVDLFSDNCTDFFSFFLKERKIILEENSSFLRGCLRKGFFFFFLESKGWAKSVPGCLQMGCYCCRSNIRVCIGWNNQNIILRLEKHALMDRRLRRGPRSSNQLSVYSKHSSTFLPFSLSIFTRSPRKTS